MYSKSSYVEGTRTQGPSFGMCLRNHTSIPLNDPIILPYIIPYVSSFKGFRLESSPPQPFWGFSEHTVRLTELSLSAHEYPDPRNDPKNGPPSQYEPIIYYIGEAGRLLGVPFFGSFRGSG